jgi:predicted MFS family arabinose efflux permease
MKAGKGASPGGVFRLLKRPAVALGMLAVSLFFLGQFALFTYLRPFLESVTHLGVPALSLMLLLVGVAGFVGTTAIGAFLENSLYRTLIAVPLVMALLAVALIAFGSSVAATAVLLGIWGLVATSAPVAWWTWLARSLPQDAEAGGGLMVAVVQLAIAAGATVGGVLFDASGYRATFGMSAAVLVLAAGVAWLAARASKEGAHRP